MVGAKGFEPSTSWSRTRRASQAALRPENRHSKAENLTAGIFRVAHQFALANKARFEASEHRNKTAGKYFAPRRTES
jgi:hypothetical protein